MVLVDVPIRAPTTTPWTIFLVTLVATGEFILEASKPEVARYFGMPFTDGEVLWAAALAGLVAMASLIWLLSLYMRPGHVVIDEGSDLLTRQESAPRQRCFHSAPLAQWHVQVTYFSNKDAAQGLFKRLTLKGPRPLEVLLFSDVARGETLALALRQVRHRLGTYEEIVQQT
ncbi:MAG: hypothetical protein R3C68_07565 [Myxococcota bacterium]